MAIRKKPLPTVLLASAFIFSLIVTVCFIDLASGNPWGEFGPPPPPTIFVRSDCTIEPFTRDIIRTGRVYNFTGDIINYTIVVECSNIVIDGKGFSLQENGLYAGIRLSNCSNVTIKNLIIRRATEGIVLENAHSNNITCNTISDITTFAIRLDRGSYSNFISKNKIVGSYGIEIKSNSNTIEKNRLTNSGSIEIDGSGGSPYLGSYNNIYANEITDCGTAFWVTIGYHNSFHANKVENCSVGVSVANIQKEWEHRSFGPRVANNRVYHNNFINNSQQVRTDYYLDTGYAGPDILYNDNFWDNGTEGNYWSDYLGNDTDNDGIGDTPYIIDTSRTDSHPLIAPFDIENNTKVIPPPRTAASPIEQQLVSLQGTWIVAALLSVTLVGIGIFVYFIKHKSNNKVNRESMHNPPTT